MVGNTDPVVDPKSKSDDCSLRPCDANGKIYISIFTIVSIFTKTNPRWSKDPPYLFSDENCRYPADFILIVI